MLNKSQCFKKISLIILSFIIMFMSISFPLKTGANASSRVEFYYVYQNAGGGYEAVFANTLGNVHNTNIVLASPSNAAIAGMAKPLEKEFCGWRLGKVEPDVFALNGGSNPSTPSNASLATPSVATPSDPEEPVITLSDHVFRPGQLVDIDEYPDWITRVGQVSFFPVFHDRYLENPQDGFDRAVEITQDRVTYELNFDRAVNIEYSLYADFSEIETISNTSVARISVRRPPHGRTGNLYIRAFYLCECCGEPIALREPLLISLPAAERIKQNTGDHSSGSTQKNQDPSEPPKTLDKNLTQKQTGEREEEHSKKSAVKKEFLVTATPKPLDGWYRSFPQIHVVAEESDIIYYKLWNTSKGETEFSVSSRVYEGNLLPFSEDGVYRLRVWRTSAIADTSKDKEFLFEFKIDRFAPKISVSYNNGNISYGSYYNSGQAATIVIRETNFSKNLVTVSAERRIGSLTEQLEISDWQSNGDVHTASLDFSKDGEYSLILEAKDLSGRVSESFKDTFTIDSQKPLLIISGVSDLSANAEQIRPIIEFSDRNIDMKRTEIYLEAFTKNKKYSLKEDIVLKGDIYFVNMKALDEDDNYVLHARIYDKAGNIAEQKISFSLNIKGATFVFLPKEFVGKYVNTAFYPKIEIWNTDEITIVSATINGKDAEYKYENGVLEFTDKIEKDGKYTVNLEVSDTAGNVSVMKPVEFYFDITPPVNIITGVRDGELYYTEVNISVYTENPTDRIQKILLNGSEFKEYTREENTGAISFSIREEGEYKLEVVSEDEAGNLSETEAIQFKIKYGESEKSEIGRIEPASEHKTWYLLLIPVAVVLFSVLRMIAKRKKG